jgi:hypothetical protein
VRGSDGDGDMPIIDDDVIGVIARCDEREGGAGRRSSRAGRGENAGVCERVCRVLSIR